MMIKQPNRSCPQHRVNFNLPGLLLTCLFLVAANVAFAGGKTDDFPFEPVSGNSHWTYDIDLDELEEGKYNLVIRSVDEAGNIRLEGPFDFKVDPETDIPLVAVAHPQPGKRVGQMLPIIGTARDDDGISRVEVSINDGVWRPAAGTEAWSAVLDAGALGDGPHIMSVKSFDLNGLESPVVIVPFVVDTSAPIGGVTDPVSGAMISGKTSFSGSLQDPNGIAILEVSRDGGESWENLRFSTDKETGDAAFDIGLDSKDMDEGPVVWWFRGTDTQGSVSEVPFLFFVDNQGPVVELRLPIIGEDGAAPVPGDVFLAGTASDLSGVAALQIQAGKNEAIDVPVYPGNPWWTWPLVLSGLKDKQVDIIIRATDNAGNVSEQKVKIPLDIDSDLPSLSVDIEVVNEETEVRTFQYGEAFLTGVFTDDDGIGVINWKYGDEEGRLEQVERSWRLDMPILPIGEMEIELTPEDRFGLIGDATKIIVRIAPDSPLIELDEYSDNSIAGTMEWTPGTVISASGGAISGSVISEAGKGLVLTYIPTGGEETTLSLRTDPENPGRQNFSIPIRKGSDPGSINFILRAADEYGGESVLGSGYYVQAPADDNGNTPDPKAGDEKVNLPLPYLREQDGAAILRSGQPLQGWTSGASAVAASIEPDSPLLRLRTSGASFTIESTKPGLSEPVRIVLADGSTSRTIVILTDHESPSWEITSPEYGGWSNGTLRVKGTVVDSGEVASMSWALEGRSFTAVEIEELGSGRYAFDFEADFSGQPDGPRIVILRAEDKAGNESEFDLPIVLDTTAPVLVMALPPAGQPVGAKSTLVYDIPGGEILEEVSISIDGIGRQFADQASLYALDLNLAGLSKLPDSLLVRATDRAGNTTEQVPLILYDPISDKPITHIQTPVAHSVVRGPTDIAGLIVDDDPIEAVFWRIDGDNWKKLPGGASFQVSLPLDSLVDGAHLLEVYAQDSAGNVGEPDSAWFDVTRREAEVVLKTPEVGVTNRGIAEISGTSTDANGIAAVWISFDNGHTFFLAEGVSDFSIPGEEGLSETDTVETVEVSEGETTETTVAPAEEEPVIPAGPIIRDTTVDWRYSMDTGVLNDGVHTLLIKVIDGAGDEALLAGLLEVDNSYPTLAVGNPEEGSVQTGSLVLEGRVMDQGGLESFSAIIERNGETLLENHEILSGVFHLPFDLSGLEAGEVLLRVEAVDTAGNSTAVSRSFIAEPGRRTVVGEITLPVEGGQEGPLFTLNGFVESALSSDTAYLLIDGVETGILELDARGRFSRDFTPDNLSEGDHIFQVDIVSGDGERTAGSPRSFAYRPLGSWITIDGFPPGMAISDRPLMSGRSGYFMEEPPEDDKDAVKKYQKTAKENKPDRVEISLDGGLTFTKAKGTEDWEFRIETGQMGEGDLPILVRSRFPDGWVYSRTLLRLDKTLPDLKLNESIADGSFNGELVISGTAADDQELDEVSVSVRQGSQNRYEVPSFVQGLYFDSSVLGATWFTAGLGVTFFDDNVKLQVSVGYSPEEVWEKGKKVPARVHGTSVGATLLANVLYLPLGYYWGPKWERLSFSIAIGANFTYFSNFGESGGGVMSSVVAQMEIPKIDFPDRKFLTYLAPYLEGKIWFFSSDVNTTPYFTGSIGLRLGLL